MATKRDRKWIQIQRIYDLFGKYTQIVIVEIENVGSGQVQKIRREINANGGQLVIGKNTVIRKALQLRTAEIPDGEEYDSLRQKAKKIPELEELAPRLKNKVGLIFTNEALHTLKKRVESETVKAPARAGIISDIDVTIPPGPTGMDPSQISFFHALSISTKIVKGQIEITKEYPVCQIGKKIGSSEVALLEKMNLKPFTYGMKAIAAYDNGTILEKSVISINPDDLIKEFQEGVRNLTAVSLETGQINKLSTSHMLANAFKNLVAVGLEIDYKFKQIENIGQAQQQQQQQQPAQDKKPAKEKTPEPSEESEGPGMGDLFG